MSTTPLQRFSEKETSGSSRPVLLNLSFKEERRLLREIKSAMLVLNSSFGVSELRDISGQQLTEFDVLLRYCNSRIITMLARVESHKDALEEVSK